MIDEGNKDYVLGCNEQSQCQQVDCHNERWIICMFTQTPFVDIIVFLIPMKKYRPWRRRNVNGITCKIEFWNAFPDELGPRYFAETIACAYWKSYCFCCVFSLCQKNIVFFFKVARFFFKTKMQSKNHELFFYKRTSFMCHANIWNYQMTLFFWQRPTKKSA